jgi:hypothetical protein
MEDSLLELTRLLVQRSLKSSKLNRISVPCPQCHSGTRHEKYLFAAKSQFHTKC